MKTLLLPVLLVSIVLPLTGNVAMAEGEGFLALPLKYAAWPSKNGCLPIANYYDDESRTGPPFVYLGSEYRTAAMWCQDEKSRKYHLLIGKEGKTGYATDFSENKACPLFIVRDQDEPGDLTVSTIKNKNGKLVEIDLAKSAYRGADGKPRQGKYSYYELTSTTRGKRTTYICYQGEWLHKDN